MRVDSRSVPPESRVVLLQPHLRGGLASTRGPPRTHLSLSYQAISRRPHGSSRCCGWESLVLLGAMSSAVWSSNRSGIASQRIRRRESTASPSDQEADFAPDLFSTLWSPGKAPCQSLGRCARLLSPAHSKMWRCPMAKRKDPMSHWAYPRAQAESLAAILLRKGDCQADDHIGSSKHC